MARRYLTLGTLAAFALTTTTITAQNQQQETNREDSQQQQQQQQMDRSAREQDQRWGEQNASTDRVGDARKSLEVLEKSGKSINDAIKLVRNELDAQVLGAFVVPESQVHVLYDVQRRRDMQRQQRRQQQDRQQKDTRTQDRDRSQTDTFGWSDRETEAAKRRPHVNVICLMDEVKLREVLVDVEKGSIVRKRSLAGAGFSTVSGRMATGREMERDRRSGDRSYGFGDDRMYRDDRYRDDRMARDRSGDRGFGDERMHDDRRTGDERAWADEDRRRADRMNDEPRYVDPVYDDRRYDDEADARDPYRIEDGRQRNASRMMRASEIMNMTVIGSNGNDLGDIEDLAIDPENGNLLYAVLIHGGLFGMGGDLHAIPCSELRFRRDESLRLGVSDRRLDEMGGFSDDDWPNHANVQLASTWESEPPTEATSDEILEASDLLGMPIRNTRNQELATVRDLVIDHEEGSVAYLLAEMEGRTHAVPMSAVDLDADSEKIVLDMDAQEFRSLPAFAQGETPQWDNVQWNLETHDRFNAKPYWHNPDEEHGNPTGTMRDRDQDRNRNRNQDRNRTNRDGSDR